MPRPSRDVVFVDGVRTPFGKAGGMYAGTRADDLVIRCIRELMRRNRTTPVYDQGGTSVVGGINVGAEMRPAFLV